MNKIYVIISDVMNWRCDVLTVEPNQTLVVWFGSKIEPNIKKFSNQIKHLMLGLTFEPGKNYNHFHKYKFFNNNYIFNFIIMYKILTIYF